MRRYLVLVLALLFSFPLSFLFLFSFLPPPPPDSPPTTALPPPPSFAYYISGEGGQGDCILRLLLAVYHPRNRYLLGMGFNASDLERATLNASLDEVPAIRSFANVDVLWNPSTMSLGGVSCVTETLRAAAILLEAKDSGWNWFVVLSAFDYPLVTQDDLSHVFSSFSRDVNFVHHTSHLKQEDYSRFRSIVLDRAITEGKSGIWDIQKKRPKPNLFKIFTGSRYVILSRSFLEYGLMGWDNLPRTLLVYFANVLYPENAYFQSVICNAPEFKSTTVNSDLSFMIPDNSLPFDYDVMVQSGAAFARRLRRYSTVLNMVDSKILKRERSRVVPGGWCIGRKSDPCSQWGDVNVVKPGDQAQKLEETMKKLQRNQCK